MGQMLLVPHPTACGREALEKAQEYTYSTEAAYGTMCTMCLLVRCTMYKVALLYECMNVHSTMYYVHRTRYLVHITMILHTYWYYVHRTSSII